MILGAGVTGLAAGMATGLPVYEAKSSAGGICASYYLNGYRFEIGGGLLPVFGADQRALHIDHADLRCGRRYLRMCGHAAKGESAHERRDGE